MPAGILGDYFKSTLSGCVKIAEGLGLGTEQIKSGVSKIKPVEHRLQLIPNPNNILVIDDSYSGNPDGVKEAIKVLSEFTDRRKIYLTPGLVEMGEKKEEVHRSIGKQLATVADKVMLIKNSVTPFIASGLEQAGYKKEQISWFDSALAAHRSLKNFLQPNDVIIFQNDWSDNYL